MLGESYWKEVQALTSLLERSRLLLDQLGSKPSEGVQEVSEELKVPYRIAFLGTAGAGKTSILREFEKASREKETLRGSHFVEIPIDLGTTRWLQEQTPDNVDALVILLHPENPWDPLIWKAVEEAERRKLPMILSLSMRDILAVPEAEVLKNHLRALTEQRLGKELPIFEASMSPVAEVDLLRKELENMLMSSPVRARLLEQGYLQVSSLLRIAEQTIDFRRSQLNEHYAYLSALENEVRSLRKMLSPKIEKGFEELSVFFVRVVKSRKRSLRGMLALLPTFFRLLKSSSIAMELEDELYEEAREILLSKVALNGRDLIEEMSQHWSGIETNIKEKLKAKVSAFDDYAPRFQEVQIAHLSHLEDALPGMISQLRLKSFLDGEVSSHQAQGQKGVMTIFVLLTIAGLCGVLVSQLVALSLVLLAVVTGVYTMFKLKHSSAKVQLHYEEYSSRAYSHFKDQMENRYHIGVRTYFRVYNTLLDGVRHNLSSNQEDLEPLSEVWNELFFEYNAIKPHHL